MELHYFDSVFYFKLSDDSTIASMLLNVKHLRANQGLKIGKLEEATAFLNMTESCGKVSYWLGPISRVDCIRL